MTARRLAPVLFLVASGLYFAAALVDLVVPTRVTLSYSGNLHSILRHQKFSKGNAHRGSTGSAQVV